MTQPEYSRPTDSAPQPPAEPMPSPTPEPGDMPEDPTEPEKELDSARPLKATPTPLPQ